MSSETITRNDLTAILNEVLPPTASEYRKLLWTNTGNTYSTGTVSLDLSSYDEVEILAAGFQTTNYVYSRCPVGQDGLIQAFTTSADSTGDAYHFMNSATRHYSISTTGVTFDNGQMTYSGNAYQNWSNRAVPLKIYGIKYQRVNPPQVEIADVVAETGSSGNWQWRKWSSGKIEAWYFSAADTFTTAINGWTQSIPSAIRPVTTIYNLQASGCGNSFVGDVHHAWINTSSNVVCLTATTAGSYSVSVYICFKN